MFNVNIYVALVKRTDPAGLFAADLIRFDALRLLQALGRMSFLATTKAPRATKAAKRGNVMERRDANHSNED